MSDVNKLALLSGEGYETSNGIRVCHPRLQDLKELGEAKYMSFVSLFCNKPHELMVQLWDCGIDYESLQDFELFMLLYNSSKEIYMELFERFMGLKQVSAGILRATGENVLYGLNRDTDDLFIVDDKIHLEIAGFMRLVHCFKNKEKPRFKSKATKELYIELQREELEDSKNRDNGLSSLISALVWGNSSGINYSNVWDLYLYQFYDGINRICRIKEYDQVMSGIYHGTLELKKIDLNNINWLSAIKI